LTYPRRVEKKITEKEKIVEEEKIVDEGIFRRERFHKQQVCVAGKNFFVNFRKGALAI